MLHKRQVKNTCVFLIFFCFGGRKAWCNGKEKNPEVAEGGLSFKSSTWNTDLQGR